MSCVITYIQRNSKGELCFLGADFSETSVLGFFTDFTILHIPAEPHIGMSTCGYWVKGSTVS